MQNFIEVQKYLRSNDDPHKLEKDFGIIVKEYDDRIVLNYHQIDSRKHRFNPIVMECRGLILSLDDYSIISKTFTRFFNLGENKKDDSIFDINKSISYEKLDGSLLSIYNHKGIWSAATRGTAFAEGNIWNQNLLEQSKYTYHDKTVQILHDIDVFDDVIYNFNLNDVCKKWNPDLNYVFELVFPENRMRTYNHCGLYLIMVYNKVKNIEYWNQIHLENIKNKLHNKNIFLPKVYNFNNMDEIDKNISLLKPIEEGYVCCMHLGKDITPLRMKIKNPKFLYYCSIWENNQSLRKTIRIVLNKDYDEIISTLGEDNVELLVSYVDTYKKIISDIINTWNKNYMIDDRKEFALSVKDYDFSSILFNLKYQEKINNKIFDDIVINRIMNKLSDNSLKHLFQKYYKYSGENDVKKILIGRCRKCFTDIYNDNIIDYDEGHNKVLYECPECFYPNHRDRDMM